MFFYRIAVGDSITKLGFHWRFGPLHIFLLKSQDLDFQRHMS